MNLTFLRHGTTDLNGKGFVATQLDYPLNEHGIVQCKSNAFSCPSFNDVFASPYKRTIETARLVYPYKKPIVTSWITQRNLGELNERYKRDFERRYLQLVKEYIINPRGAETLDDVIKRLNAFFEYLKSNYEDNQNILIVTHNGIMRIVKRYYMNVEGNVESENLGKFSMILKK